jgi:malonyl-CoA decarboxylase
MMVGVDEGWRTMSFIDRTFESLRRAWQGTPLSGTVRPDLPDGDLAKIREKIDACLDLRGGEVSARQRAGELGRIYLELNDAGRIRFLSLLARDYGCDEAKLLADVNKFSAAENAAARDAAERAMRRSLVPRRMQLLTQFNALPQGVKFLVDMRAEILGWVSENPELDLLQRDLKDLLASWFDIGFLELRSIDWGASAALLEKLMDYEAVHEIRSWTDLKNRLEPDRRCFAFFHPRMPNEPLIFVEVALVVGIAGNIHDLLDVEAPAQDPQSADTAIFYSISNCQSGLAGVSFGNFLIKRVVSELRHEFPNLKNFATLSPVPGFMKWLRGELDNKGAELFIDTEAVDIRQVSGIELAHDGLRALLAQADWWLRQEVRDTLQPILLRLITRYLLQAQRRGRALDPVANFHLSNGARLEQVNWLADRSANGLRQSAGMMVNYLYRLDHIDRNHEEYRSDGTVNAGSSVRRLMR